MLETAAQAFPGNVDVYNTLAGAYLKAGEPKRAVAIYASLDLRHASLAQYHGAIGAALAAHDLKQAETWLQAALDLYKDDADILKMAAQYEQAEGDAGRAAAYYRAALDAMGPQSPSEIFSHSTTRPRTPAIRRAAMPPGESSCACWRPQVLQIKGRARGWTATPIAENLKERPMSRGAMDLERRSQPSANSTQPVPMIAMKPPVLSAATMPLLRTATIQLRTPSARQLRAVRQSGTPNRISVA